MIHGLENVETLNQSMLESISTRYPSNAELLTRCFLEAVVETWRIKSDKFSKAEASLRNLEEFCQQVHLTYAFG